MIFDVNYVAVNNISIDDLKSIFALTMLVKLKKENLTRCTYIGHLISVGRLALIKSIISGILNMKQAVYWKAIHDETRKSLAVKTDAQKFVTLFHASPKTLIKVLPRIINDSSLI